MKENNIIINTKSNMLSIEHLYTVEDYFTFKIKVISGEFSGASNFCISRDNIILAVENLSKIHEKLKGYYEINDYDSDSYINIEMGKFGHLYISGQIGGSHEEHFVKFKLITDQTILAKLIQILKDLLLIK